MTVYLDWNATAPLRPVARQAWLAAQDDSWANPSSIHGPGQQARFVVDDAKQMMGALLGCRSHELVVTSGGTEANALAIHQVVARGGIIAASVIDHSSVLRNAEPAVRLPVDGDGRLDPAVIAGIPLDTALVCLQFANNEIGTLQDIPALVAAIRARCPTSLVHLDACQGTGKIRYDLRGLGVDTAAIAGHKFGAPKGVGLLYARTGLKLQPLLRGGRQQQDRRSGTEDPALVMAMAAALVESLSQADAEAVRQRALLDHTFSTIQAALAAQRPAVLPAVLPTVLPRVQWIASGAHRLPNTMSLACPGISNEILVQRLDLSGFAVSTGAACMAARGEPSHVIAALGVDRDLARSAIRVSIGPGTSADDLDRFAAAYVREVTSLRS